MRPRFRLSARIWLMIPVGVFGLLVWINYERVRRVENVANTDREEAVVDAVSPTGYAGGKRWLIVPAYNHRSYQWIAETQQMLAKGEWRVRHVDYDNAPVGREVHAASPYRWWLGLLAWCDHAVSGRPLGLAVERAALFADPALHLLLLLGTAFFVARHFGVFPASLLAVGLATIYPFAGEFLPGVPDDHGLAWACSLWSVLPLLAGTGGINSLTATIPGEAVAIAAASMRRRARRLFLTAGVAGGLGLWIGAASQLSILLGVALGGMLAAWIAGRGRKTEPSLTREIAPWRLWALGGAAASLAAFLIEYYPAHMELQLRVNHPLYGLAWIGLGEILAQVECWFKRGKSSWNSRQAVSLVLAVAAIAALPAAMALSGSAAFLTGDQLASRLSSLPNGVVAKNFPAWIGRDGLTAIVGATCLPLLLLGPAAWLLARGKSGCGPRAAIAVAIGPVLIALLLACLQLKWWSLCDAMLLALLVAVAAVDLPRLRWWWSGFAGLIFLPGLVQLLPLPAGPGENIELTRPEVEGLVERALAHWIADHADPGGAVILVPPARTTSWCFHGGLRGLGSANWENRDGLTATVRIATATTADQALALIRERGVTHLIIPSWDSDLDEFARWSLPNPEDAFIMALHHWALPTWLRPLPYKLPVIPGLEGQSVVILKVTEESNRAAALARLAEYFIESEQVELAANLSPVLQRYPTDLGALVALAQVEKVRGDAEGLARTFNALLASLAGGSDRTLAWDRRVSLAVVLAQGERHDLAREQVRRCLERIDETRLRSLTTASLFRLLALSRAFELSLPDPGLRELALKLLPGELRRRL